MESENIEPPQEPKSTFEKDLEGLINRYSVENYSNTPDFILASYIKGCLENFAETIGKRDRWWGHETFGNRLLTQQAPPVQPSIAQQ